MNHQRWERWFGLHAADPVLPPRSHPNYWRWHRYHLDALWRGRLVAELLCPLLPPAALTLDIGCGVGGASVVLASGGAKVLALELDRCRLEVTRQLAQASGLQVTAVQGDGSALPFKDQTLHGVVLQDVLEHVRAPQQLLVETARVLKRGGVVFLSTPNRWSPWNFFSDPHWGLPLVAVLPRVAVAALTRRRRDSGSAPTGVPSLPSMRALRKWMRQAGLVMSFVNRTAARVISAEPRAAFCDPVHLRLASWAERAGVLCWLPKVVNDRSGVFNWWLNPTWYIVAQKP